MWKSDYQRALGMVKTRLEGSAAMPLLLSLEARLQENLHEESLFGRHENVRAERFRIVHELNRLTLAELGTSFNDLAAQPPGAEEKLNERETSPGWTLEALRRFDILDELAHVFDREPKAEELLERLKIPRGRRPQFVAERTSYAFWLRACTEILNGQGPTMGQLMSEAAALYPGNSVFHRWKGIESPPGDQGTLDE